LADVANAYRSDQACGLNSQVEAAIASTAGFATRANWPWLT